MEDWVKYGKEEEWSQGEREGTSEEMEPKTRKWEDYDNSIIHNHLHQQGIEKLSLHWLSFQTVDDVIQKSKDIHCTEDDDTQYWIKYSVEFVLLCLYRDALVCTIEIDTTKTFFSYPKVHLDGN